MIWCLYIPVTEAIVLDQINDIRLHEGELNVMELLWSNKSLAAKDIAEIISEYIGWKKNTTYTVINRLIEKGAIVRQEPGFICKANITKKAVQKIETKALIDKLFNGSNTSFISEYIRLQQFSNAELLEIQKVLYEKNTYGNR